MHTSSLIDEAEAQTEERSNAKAKEIKLVVEPEACRLYVGSEVLATREFKVSKTHVSIVEPVGMLRLE